MIGEVDELAAAAGPEVITASPERAAASRRSAPSTRRRTKAQRAKIARQNGAKGGRPPAKLPKESLERLGPPPSHPLKLAAWCQSLIAEIAWLVACGKIGPELASSLRATASAMQRAVAPATQAALAELLAAEAAETTPDDQGPEPEKETARAATQALRR